MSTITAILEPDADGTLHLPVPAEWQHRAIKVTAELEPVSTGPTEAPLAARAPQPGCLKGIWMAPDFDEPLEDFREYSE